MQAKSKTVIFILLSFLIGAAAGGYAGGTFFGKKGSSRPSRADIMKEFTERVRLEESQIAIVDSLVETYRSKLGELRKSYSETFKHQRDSLRKEIRKVLSEEQNQLYDQYIKEMDERESRSRKERKEKESRQ